MKAALRRGLRDARSAARNGRTGPAALADRVLALEQVRVARCVAAYAALPGEPDPAPAVRALLERGVRVLLPVLLADLDLDWAAAGAPLAPSEVQPRLLEPTGPRLGVDALAEAEVVLVPALAVDASGVRLGQGGGSYDRALARAPHALRVALVADEEVLERLPTEPHDQRVHLAVTPTRTLELGAATTAPPSRAR